MGSITPSDIAWGIAQHNKPGRDPRKCRPVTPSQRDYLKRHGMDDATLNQIDWCIASVFINNIIRDKREAWVFSGRRG